MALDAYPTVKNFYDNPAPLPHKNLLGQWRLVYASNGEVGDFIALVDYIYRGVLYLLYRCTSYKLALR